MVRVDENKTQWTGRGGVTVSIKNFSDLLHSKLMAPQFHSFLCVPFVFVANWTIYVSMRLKYVGHKTKQTYLNIDDLQFVEDTD